ncbi:DUF1549 domain-containing protein [Planctomicrobium sp. SH527]|uniref:DUF1549 domain-containing protein n=1 Tax=Planctomicrobium sp. SH527 TaxID=3448123 RepID=UPI003F5C9544
MFHRSILAIGLGSLISQASLLADDNPVTTPAEIKQDAAKVEFFEKKIRPLLVENCYTCHSASTNARGGLRVDEQRGILAGGGRGKAIVPSEPGKSLLIKAVKHGQGAPAMPPDSKLSDEQIANLERWIADGAVWPVEAVAVHDYNDTNSEYKDLLQDHWAWQPVVKSTIPAVRQQDWAKSEIDLFILAKLEAKNLQPAQPASKETLIRRVTFDLTGVPPTPEEVDQFLADNSADAYAKLVDRLLDSPAFGEHWGRHWLDVARYGESTGSARNLPYPHAWKYRDYVINAVNADKPYDDFIQEQIAGDLLPYQSEEERIEQLTATGFLALGVKDVNQRFKNRFILDNIDEQIDTVSQAVLGLTVSCARCHDHKFDPIPTKDYYALVGIFQSTDLCAGVRNKMGGGGLDYYDTSMLLPLEKASDSEPVETEEIKDLKKRLQNAQTEFRRLQQSDEGLEKLPNGRNKRQAARQRLNRLQQELSALTDPAANGPVVLGVRDSKTIADAEIRVRGEAEKYGPVVPRGFLSLFNLPDVQAIPENSSGRLEFAKWLTHPQNPLTTRVIVNRVWGHLFGAGLVSTPDNFGVNGDHPSHPELLDYLALRYVNQGWSTKSLIRDLVSTQSYQMSAAADEKALAVDPQNRWLWRHPPRRLTAEEIRDAMLVSSKLIDHKRPEASPAAKLKVVELRNNGAEARQLEAQGRDSRARSVYLPLVRGLVPTSLYVFDFAEQGLVVGHRDETTVPPQALYMLNDFFVREVSQNLAVNILKANSTTPERIQSAYRAVLGRNPDEVEAARVEQYIADITTSANELQQLADRLEQGKKSEKQVASAAPVQVAQGTGGAAAQEVIDPDQIVQGDAPIEEKKLKDVSVETTAYASFIQALYGSAEFRYLK